MNLNWTEIIGTLLEVVIGIAVTVILPKLPGLTKQGFDWLATQSKKVNNEYAAGVLTRLSSMMGALVIATENTLIEDLKERARNGKLTKEDLPQALAGVKAIVLNKFKELATAQQLWAIALTIFGGDQQRLDAWIDQLLEAHVSELPASGLQTDKNGMPLPVPAAVVPAAAPVP